MKIILLNWVSLVFDFLNFKLSYRQSSMISTITQLFTLSIRSHHALTSSFAYNQKIHVPKLITYMLFCFMRGICPQYSVVWMLHKNSGMNYLSVSFWKVRIDFLGPWLGKSVVIWKLLSSPSKCKENGVDFNKTDWLSFCDLKLQRKTSSLPCNDLDSSLIDFFKVIDPIPD